MRSPKAQQSFEAIRLIGQLGDFSTDTQTAKLMDEMRASGRSTVVDAIVQMQMTNKLRQWPQLSDAEQTDAINSFVSDVKKCGVSPADLPRCWSASRARWK